MSGTILPTYAADAYLYGTPQAVPQQAAATGPSILGSLLGQPASPLTSRQTANQAAVDTLLGIATGSGTPAGPGPGAPSGAKGTGNPATDIPNAIEAFGPVALGMLADPTGIPGAALGLGIGAAARAAAGIPNPTTPQAGLVGAIKGAAEALFGITPEERAAREAAIEAASGVAGMKGEADPDTIGTTLSAEEAAALGPAPDKSSITNPVSEGSMTGAATAVGLGDMSTGFGDGSQAGGAAGAGSQGAGGSGSTNLAGGGLVGYAGGGVIQLEGGGKVAIGPGGGLDDLIPTNINGRRAAALSDGEFVVPADVVSMMGDGSSNAGARRLYDLVRQIRQEKTGTSKQAGPLPVGELLKRTMS